MSYRLSELHTEQNVSDESGSIFNSTSNISSNSISNVSTVTSDYIISTAINSVSVSSSNKDDLLSITGDDGHDGGLPDIAIHFIVVASLFGVVVLLGLANLYIHYHGNKDGGRGRGYFQADDGRTSGTRVRGYSRESRSGYYRSKTSVTIKMKPTRPGI